VLEPIPELSEENAQPRSGLVSVDSNSSKLVAKADMAQPQPVAAQTDQDQLE